MIATVTWSTNVPAVPNVIVPFVVVAVVVVVVVAVLMSTHSVETTVPVVAVFSWAVV